MIEDSVARLLGFKVFITTTLSYRQWGPAVDKRPIGVQAQTLISCVTSPAPSSLRRFLDDDFFFWDQFEQFSAFLASNLHVPRGPHLTLTSYRSAATDEYYHLNLPNQQREERGRYG